MFRVRRRSMLDARCPVSGPTAPIRYRSGRVDAASCRWDAAMDAALAPGSTPDVRLESALVAIDAHLDALVRCPAGFGDTMGAEILAWELLFLRAVLCGVEPFRHGGEALNRAKVRKFKSCNGPCSNWIGRDDYAALSPLLALAVRAERKRHGVPSKVPLRRAAKGGAA